jgi:transposase
VIADASGRAIGFALAPGQAHELPLAPLLLTLLSLIPAWIVADRGYASHAFRDRIWRLGAGPAIPSKRNEAPVACPPWIYVNRNRVERLWARRKEWRAVAHPLREDRLLLHGRALHGCHHGLDQVAAQNSGTDRP